MADMPVTLREALDFLGGYRPETVMTYIVLTIWYPDEDFTGDRWDPGVAGVSVRLGSSSGTVGGFMGWLRWALGEDVEGLPEFERWVVSDSEPIFVNEGGVGSRCRYTPLTRARLESFLMPSSGGV